MANKGTPLRTKPASVSAARRAAKSTVSTRAVRPAEVAPVPAAEPTPVDTVDSTDAASQAARRGSRGAAPWATRHAAKQAAEKARRLEEPVRPGSARATLRTPDNADDIKSQILRLHTMLTQLNTFKKTLSDSFYEAGELLAEIRDKKLYSPKGYRDFDSFVEREVTLSKTTALALAEIPEVFTREAAKGAGLESTISALTAFRQAHSAKQVRARPSRPPVARVIIRD
ncbi:MAG: hypothetical protein SFV15_18180 [Polyangiaceae bacterium]|nr:hypothetical protein [Polyangiaceae bacterium]